MEKSISADIKTNVIIFWDKTKIFITAIENKNIESLMLNGMQGFEVSGNKYKFKDISKFLTIEKYYDLYPDNRQQNYKDYTNTKQIPYSAQRHLNGLKEMRKGFLKHFQGREIPENSQEILNNMDLVIKNFKAGDIASPSKVFFGDRS